MLPTLKSNRLMLRPYRAQDACRVQLLAGEKIIADMTANIPHPYLDGMAEDWISRHARLFADGKAISLAIDLNDTGEHIGAISVNQIVSSSGYLGYWVGVPYWGQGYCTEAVDLILRYGFEVFGLVSMYARHLPTNPASGKVMVKNGFSYKDDVMVGDKRLKHYELDANRWRSFKKTEFGSQI